MFPDLPVGYRLTAPEMAQAGFGAPSWRKVSRKHGSYRLVQMYQACRGDQCWIEAPVVAAAGGLFNLTACQRCTKVGGCEVSTVTKGLYVAFTGPNTAVFLNSSTLEPVQEKEAQWEKDADAWGRERNWFQHVLHELAEFKRRVINGEPTVATVSDMDNEADDSLPIQPTELVPMPSFSGTRTKKKKKKSSQRTTTTLALKHELLRFAAMKRKKKVLLAFHRNAMETEKVARRRTEEALERERAARISKEAELAATAEKLAAKESELVQATDQLVAREAEWKQREEEYTATIASRDRELQETNGHLAAFVAWSQAAPAGPQQR
ncbi:uncharacterized protein LOC62_05G006794 [Vanrija pseudolonga]|uniref:Uncharacterized protein n=1 Tax=Vanrija pseudolonga TaxID=143232 RepID=A0AAF0YC61_9TREE|nr:hypothetical protein LOC62_05G006794 [Vanrija pseudolonga]